ncbi:FliM/FliN family flagellar motor switch protein [Buttiauxella noackiae]|jgi:flagellar motor switch protein FliM|uniref:FliM family flagellar motor switch protein n=1 Tax=Buttiauxella noackiae ATCC 51607 TaxID=1354255 RepID=A0A1B7HLM5_9ENTR|nr:FliM/FliN family flagellar motor C-terminal domain-containing protein [Buttiauxella noackiae]MCA1923136.1 FliM/FliN family flagellar motor C-terminal domain-containing protein [Buttiauxella noackiae]OAT16533.1 FliM family flagellar motor switch protein [Buttiauxella noackiae ATCC 51607]
MQNASHRIRVYQASDCPELTRLDVSKLGRAYHKIPKIISTKFDSIEARLGIFFLKKYRLNALLSNLTFDIDYHCKNAQIFSTPYGSIGFDINRKFLLSILHTYYGLSKEGNTVSLDLTQSVTKTEDRLKIKLGQELLQLTMVKEVLNETLELKNDYTSIIHQWPYSVRFWLEGYDEYCFSILLDAHHVDLLLATSRVDSESDEPKAKNLSSEQIEHMFNNMPLTLTGRLVSINLTVAQLLNIGPGDIIPVSLNEPLPVFIENEQIFSSVVAEERGRLYLSEFNDKTPEMKYE